MEKTTATLSPPWVELFDKMEAFFAEDPEVKVLFEPDDYTIKLLVKDQDKANALEQLLVKEHTFGNIKVNVIVVPANEPLSTIDLYRRAFAGNEAVSRIYTNDNPAAYQASYIIFEKEVVQFFNDNLSDAHGVTSTLNQEIAKELFVPTPGIYFCTDTDFEGALGKPLGEWP